MLISWQAKRHLSKKLGIDVPVLCINGSTPAFEINQASYLDMCLSFTNPGEKAFKAYKDKNTIWLGALLPAMVVQNQWRSFSQILRQALYDKNTAVVNQLMAHLMPGAEREMDYWYTIGSGKTILHFGC